MGNMASGIDVEVRTRGSGSDKLELLLVTNYQTTLQLYNDKFSDE